MASKKIIYKESEVLSYTELQGIEEMKVVHLFRRYFDEQIKPVYLYAQLLDAYCEGYAQAMKESFMAAKKKAKAVKKPAKKK